jgi:predicted Zn-dependent protease
MRSSTRQSTALFAAVLIGLAAALGAPGCATNPATGQRQLALISQSQELALGRESDEQIVASIGLYDDAELAAYVDRVGQRLAAESERPDLDWSFKVMDDPTVNAFALPGGYIYVTRGILAHLSSEAELASVLGHEIGHVTARHSVSRLSKAQLATLGLGIGMIVSEELRDFGALAQAGLGLLFLKYSRDDERQADELGLRYLVRGEYDAREMPEVFLTLQRVGEQAGGGRVPGYLATHPDPGARAATATNAVAALGADFSSARVAREAYLRELDGIVFGADPREGFFRDGRYYHPELAFEMAVPEGWARQNLKQAVQAVAPDKDAVIALTLVEGSAREAARKLAAGAGMDAGSMRTSPTNGLPSAGFTFEATEGEKEYRGVVRFVEHGGRTFRLLGLTPADRWSRHDDALADSVDSFARLTDRDILSVQPARLALVEIPGTMGVAELQRRYPSTADDDTVAVINHLTGEEELPAGALAKRIVGGPPRE